MERVVRHFQEELEGLQARLLEMGGLAEERVRAAVQGLVSRDLAITEKVMRGDEPLKIVKEGLNRLDGLDKMLAAAAPDQVAAQAAAKEFGGATCAACHKQFREGDAQSGFRFREPGIL